MSPTIPFIARSVIARRSSASRPHKQTTRPRPKGEGSCSATVREGPLTIAMLQQAWIACQRNESLHERNELLGISQQRESEDSSHSGLDALDDQTVNRLYHNSLRQYAKTVKRGPGILA